MSYWTARGENPSGVSRGQSVPHIRPQGQSLRLHPLHPLSPLAFLVLELRRPRAQAYPVYTYGLYVRAGEPPDTAALCRGTASGIAPVHDPGQAASPPRFLPRPLPFILARTSITDRLTCRRRSLRARFLCRSVAFIPLPLSLRASCPRRWPVCTRPPLTNWMFPPLQRRRRRRSYPRQRRGERRIASAGFCKGH